MKDKHFAAIAGTFCVVLGLAICDTFSFTSGLFAGAAATLAFAIWTEDE